MLNYLSPASDNLLPPIPKNFNVDDCFCKEFITPEALMSPDSSPAIITISIALDMLYDK